MCACPRHPSFSLLCVWVCVDWFVSWFVCVNGCFTFFGSCVDEWEKGARCDQLRCGDCAEMFRGRFLCKCSSFEGSFKQALVLTSFLIFPRSCLQAYHGAKVCRAKYVVERFHLDYFVNSPWKVSIARNLQVLSPLVLLLLVPQVVV